MARIPIEEQIAEVERELALRARVYPAFIARGRLTTEDAALQARRLEAVRDTLQWLATHRDTILALGRDAMALHNEPAIAAALTAFPDAVISRVHPMGTHHDLAD